jgi:hypothetical protein
MIYLSARKTIVDVVEVKDSTYLDRPGFDAVDIALLNEDLHGHEEEHIDLRLQQWLALLQI